MIRVWGFPTSHGGIDYFLIERDGKKYIREFGTDDMGNSVDNEMTVNEFLKAVKTQNDFKNIECAVKNEKENIHL